jgi:hypothetical protein
LAHYPVFTLSAVSTVGCILAIAVLLAGFWWLSVVIFAATTLVICGLLARWIGRSAK